MNRIHEKNLRTMLSISDAKAVLSKRAIARIERMETRMTRFFGCFREMQAEVLACLVNDLDDEEVFYVPEPEEPERPKQTPEEYIARMKPEAVEAELKKRGVELSGNETASELRGLLLESVKDKKVKV